MPKLYPHPQLRAALADNRLTSREWRSLAPQLEPSGRADVQSRVLLGVYASDRYEISSSAASELQEHLRAHGYPVPEERPRGRAETVDFMLQVRGGNVSEHDLRFRRLVRATGREDERVTVGVLDSGFDVSHPAFEDKRWRGPSDDAGNDVHGWDFVDGDAEVLGHSRHGTHVLGIATAGTAQLEGIAVRTTNPKGPHTPPDAPKETTEERIERLVGAVDYAAENGAKVVNMSFKLSGPKTTAAVVEAMQRHPDVLFVKSAGNDGAELGEGDYASERFLASRALPNLLVVASAEPEGGKADSSNYGADYATHAYRGVEVFSSVLDDGYEAVSGTSMAAPGLANLAGRMLVLDDGLGPDAIKAMLSDCTTRSPAWEGLVAAGGEVDKEKALRLAALTGLLRRGLPEEEATKRIGLKGEERAELVTLAADYR